METKSKNKIKRIDFKHFYEYGFDESCMMLPRCRCKCFEPSVSSVMIKGELK